MMGNSFHEVTQRLAALESKVDLLKRAVDSLKRTVAELKRDRLDREPIEIHALRRLAALGCVCAGYETADCVACRAQRALDAVKKEEEAKERREFDDRVELACERYRKAMEGR